MSSAKRRLVNAGLAAFTAWPLVQMTLVRSYDVNPWKLAGWGMYAAPQIPAELRVTTPGTDGVAEPSDRQLPPNVQPQARRFLERRLALGRLASPDRLGRALLLELDVERVRIEVLQPILDPRTGHMREATTAYVYERE